MLPLCFTSPRVPRGTAGAGAGRAARSERPEDAEDVSVSSRGEGGVRRRQGWSGAEPKGRTWRSISGPRVRCCSSCWSSLSGARWSCEKLHFLGCVFVMWKNGLSVTSQDVWTGQCAVMFSSPCGVRRAQKGSELTCSTSDLFQVRKIRGVWASSYWPLQHPHILSDFAVGCST